jgi:hypothetical protein
MDLRGATRGSVLIFPRRDLISAQVSRLGSTECKLWVKDFGLCTIRFNALVFSLLTLHHHHLRETTLDKVP